jgi:predicted transcriptional regulator of viral defense system
MKYPELKRLSSRLYFTYEDVAEELKIRPASARVLCTRYVKRGLFVRLKKNLYSLRERWEQNSLQDFYRIANILQVPSYISLMSALSFYEVTTQVQIGIVESICIKRTRKEEIAGIALDFYKIRKELYFDFLKIEDFFIATKEKAFLDAVYLYSFGKYAYDLSSLDLEKLDMKRLTGLLERFPDRTKRNVEKICGI